MDWINRGNLRQTVRLIVLALLGAAFSIAVPPPTDLPSVTQALSQHRYSDALKLVDSILPSRPTDPRAWTAKGIALAGLGKTQEALECYRTAIRLMPDCLPALEGAAQIEYGQRDARARATLDRILSIQPANQSAHAMAAVLAFERKDCAAAARHFDNAHQAIARNVIALHQFGDCLVSLRQNSKAAGVFRRILSFEPTNAEAGFNLGLALLLARDYGAAITALRPLAEGAEPDSDALNLLGNAYQANGQTDLAVTTLRKSIAAAPQDERNYLDLAAICMDHNNYDLGIEIVNTGLHTIPDSAALYGVRGVLYAQMSQFAEAEADFSRANLLQPRQLYGTVGLGISLMQTGGFDASIGLLRRRLAEAPGDCWLSYLLSEAFFRKGVAPGEPEFREARSALEACVRAEPGSARSHTQLSRLYMMTGDMAGALSESETAVKVAPEDRTALYHLAVVLRKTGRQDEASRLLRKFRSIAESERQEEFEKSKVRLVRGGGPPT